jgi:hypothetical protein
LHRSTMVPCKYKEDPKLGNWVSLQRQEHKNDTLLPKRLALLNSIDFDWDRTTKDQMVWMIMFQNLLAYKEHHNTTMVPLGYNGDPKLGRWVSKQRYFYNRGELLPKRAALLDSIGFIWNGTERQST